MKLVATVLFGALLAVAACAPSSEEELDPTAAESEEGELGTDEAAATACPTFKSAKCGLFGSAADITCVVKKRSDLQRRNVRSCCKQRASVVCPGAARSIRDVFVEAE